MAQQEIIATKIVETLQQRGFTAYFAGGCVRDKLLNRTPKDYDVATNARPDQVEQLFCKTLPIGKAFGVIAVIESGETIEVATFRKDIGTTDGRRPETVAFCAAEEDAKRRDFTINGLFFDPVTQELIDFVDGQRDLERKIIRAIGDPHTRFQEDHLRMLRAVRFSHNLHFPIHPDTELAIRNMARLICRISTERIEAEFTRLLTGSPEPGTALAHLHKLGLLQHIIPEMLPMIGQEQPPQFHPEGDVFEHTVLMLNLMNKLSSEETSYTTRELAYTVLLHDVGKPPTASVGPGKDGELRIRFDGHAAVGSQMAEAILTRLRLPKREIQHIVQAIHGHMRFMDVQHMRQATLRKMMGAETFDLEMELHRLDCLGSHAMLDNYDFLRDRVEEMENEPALPEPWIRGNDLMALGLKEGRRIGEILKAAYDVQLETRFATKADLLEWVRQTYSI